MKKILTFLLLAALLLTSCGQTLANEGRSTETETAPQTTELITDADTIQIDTQTAEITDTEENPSETDEEDEPAQITGPITAPSIRDLKAFCESKSELEDVEKIYTNYSKEAWQNIDTSKWRELSGLEDEYKEAWVEWGGGNEYVIYYGLSDGSSDYTFFWCPSEENLEIEMEYFLSDVGTYEELVSNEYVCNLVKTPIETMYGSGYECVYDAVSGETGYGLRYWEYTDEDTGIDYVCYQRLRPGKTLVHSAVFVFDGPNSFRCGSFNQHLSIEFALTLKSVPLE